MRYKIITSGEVHSSFPVNMTEDEAEIVHRVLSEFNSQVKNNGEPYAACCYLESYPVAPEVAANDKVAPVLNKVKPIPRIKTTIELAFEKAGIYRSCHDEDVARRLKEGVRETATDIGNNLDFEEEM